MLVISLKSVFSCCVQVSRMYLAKKGKLLIDSEEIAGFHNTLSRGCRSNVVFDIAPS